MRVYVDLDGVLADFDHRARHLFGMHPTDYEELHGAAVFWKKIAETPDFYRLLSWMPDGVELWNGVLDLSPTPPIVLTGLPRGTWAEPQKREWCRRELGQVTVICCLSIDKAKYCNEGDILIDDRAKARLDWETAGGRFIHFTDAPAALAQLGELLTPSD